MVNKYYKIILGLSGLFCLGLFVWLNPFELLSDKQIASVINSNNEVVALDKPLEITLLGKAELSYKGSTESRIKNIKLAVSRINGTIVKPNQEFSFNQTLGPVLAEDGFEEAKSFLNGEVVLGLGGGICQVSTILFESLVNSGLPITERHNHTFSVSYYTTGLDATVSHSGPDLKFVNDTGYDIEIKGSVTDKNTVVFEIYGVGDGRIVSISKAEISDPTSLPITKYIETNDKTKDGVCENTSQIGYTAKVFYNVLYKDGINREQIFDSLYKPLARICYLYTDPITACNSTTLYSRITGMKCNN